MNTPAIGNVNIPSLQMAEAELIKVLETSMYPGASQESIKLVIGYCRAQGLDPMQKPVHIVPMQVKQKKRDRQGNELNATEYVWRDVVMPGIGLYRTNASRTGEYAGIAAAEFGPDVTEEFGGEDKMEWDEQAHKKLPKGKWDRVSVTYPKWCEVVVERIVQGQPRRFSSGKVFWKEAYSTASKDTTLPNAIWKKRGYGQVEKCAEALALRRAFPELGAAATAEEMEGKTIEDATIIDGATGTVRPQVEGPKAKSESAAQPASQSRAATSDEGNADDSEAAAAGSGAEPEREKGNGKAVSKPISQGAANILRRKMQQSAKTDTDLAAKFGLKSVEEVTTDKYNAVVEWAGQSAAH